MHTTSIKTKYFVNIDCLNTCTLQCLNKAFCICYISIYCFKYLSISVHVQDYHRVIDQDQRYGHNKKYLGLFGKEQFF